MRDIFADLYNKVLSFFVPPETDPTKDMAKSRLKTVLMQDRVGFSERAMQMLKEELILTISKYMEIDEEEADLEINSEGDNTALKLCVNVTRAKTDEEIDEAIEEQAAKTQVKAQEIVEELEELIKERAAALANVPLDTDDNDEQQEKPHRCSDEMPEVDEVAEQNDEADKSEQEPKEELEKEPKKKKNSKVKEN